MELIDDEQITMLVESAGLDAVLPIMDAYWESNDELKAAIKRGLDQQNPADVAASAHGLKGSSANLGASVVSGRAKEIEMAAKAGDLQAARAAYDKLDQDIAATRAAFEKILST